MPTDEGDEKPTAETRLILRIDDVWYDCTGFAARHPGGAQLLQLLSGEDATDLFYSTHRLPGAASAALATLPRASRPTRTVKCETRLMRDFRRLDRELEQRGLYEPQPLAYAPRAAALAALLFVSAHSASWLCSALAFALFLQQCAFIGHDAGHNTVLRTRRGNALLGVLVGNACTGISMAWWKSTHNVHHAMTNSLDCDPDVQHAPVLAMHAAYLDPHPVWSRFHARALEVPAAARRLLRWQHYFYYPLMAVARFNLYVQSIAHVVNPEHTVPLRALELAGLGVYYAGLTSLALSWPSAHECAAWLVVSHAAAGILHVQITLSHFFMEYYLGASHRATPVAERFVRTQLATTTDIACPPCLQWVHGGLDMQTTHHLFPRLPRDALARARPLVRAFCDAHGLTYHSVGWCAANARLVRALATAGRRGDAGLLREAWVAAG